MSAVQDLPRPRCHLDYVTGPAGAASGARTAVWICEYPYRTMRLSGPSAECEDCPVWQELQRSRRVLDSGGDEPQDDREQLPANV